tara:strand:+ start:197 stop:568 length:372 start_codon:yes stop_codon:yes gene_type:complete
MNHVMLIGNLGRKPEYKKTKNDKLVVNCSLATRERKDDVTWHNITAFDKTAEILQNYCDKGSKIAIEGRISNRQYEANGEKRIWSEVVANRVELLDRKLDGPGSMRAAPFENKQDDFEDDIPF